MNAREGRAAVPLDDSARGDATAPPPGSRFVGGATTAAERRVVTNHDSNVPEAMWTYRDLASYTRIPAASLRMMVSRDRLPHVRVGPRTVRFQPAAIRAWLASRSTGGRP